MYGGMTDLRERCDFWRYDFGMDIFYSSVIGKQNSVISRLDRLQCSAFTTHKHKIRSNMFINKPFGT